MDIREKLYEMKNGAERALAKYPYMSMAEKKHHMLTAVIGKLAEDGTLDISCEDLNEQKWALTEDLIEAEAKEIRKKGLY